MLTLTMFSVITRCLGFIYKIYLTKIMSTTELGIYNLTLSVYMVLITIVGSSIPLTISKITSVNNSNDKKEFTNYSVTSSLILTTTLSLCLSLLIIISQPLLTLIIGDALGYQIIIYLLPSLIFTAIYSQLRGYLWGLENYFAVSIVEFIEQILRIVFCIIFVLLGVFNSPVIAVSCALSIACGISTILGIFLYYKNGGKFKYKNGYYKEIIKSSLPLTAIRFFGSILQPLIAVILPIQLNKLGMSKDMALSELGIVMGMTMPLLSIPSTIIGALCMILIPKVSSSTKDKRNINRQINYYLNFTISCVFIFIPIFIAIGPSACEFVFNNSTAGIYLQYASWTMLPLGIAQITTSILNALNQERKSFIYYIISSFILVASVFILPKYIGIQAIVFGSGLSSTILAILNIMKIKKLTNLKPNIIGPCISHILVSLPVILLINLLKNVLDNILTQFVSLGICSIVGVVSYITLLFVFNVLDIKIVKDYLLKFSNKKYSKLN